MARAGNGATRLGRVKLFDKIDEHDGRPRNLISSSDFARSAFTRVVYVQDFVYTMLLYEPVSRVVNLVRSFGVWIAKRIA